MTTFAKISVVTPSYNHARFIRQTIDSVLGQGYPNLEYIVIDGGSTDGTIDILRSYGDRISWVSEKDRGQSDAINKGMRLSSGDILAYLNSDDLYQPRALFAVNDFFQHHPDITWAYGRCRVINENNQEIRRAITAYKNFWMRRYSYRKLLAINFISQPATFWRKKIRDEIGLFDENEHLVMDYAYWLRIGQRYSAGFIPAYLADFRMYAASKSFQSYRQQFQDELRLAKKHADSRLPILLHRLNYVSILAGYKILQKIS